MLILCVLLFVSEVYGAISGVTVGLSSCAYMMYGVDDECTVEVSLEIRR